MKKGIAIADVLRAFDHAAAVAGGVIAHQATRGLKGPADVQQWLDPSRR